jgi:hypothetical protein
MLDRAAAEVAAAVRSLIAAVGGIAGRFDGR